MKFLFKIAQEPLIEAIKKSFIPAHVSGRILKMCDMSTNQSAGKHLME